MNKISDMLKSPKSVFGLSKVLNNRIETLMTTSVKERNDANKDSTHLNLTS
jgi:hypothetical protein